MAVSLALTAARRESSSDMLIPQVSKPVILPRGGGLCEPRGWRLVGTGESIPAATCPFTGKSPRRSARRWRPRTIDPGGASPPLRSMAIESQVNPNTIWTQDELVREDLIYCQRGKGLYVFDEGRRRPRPRHLRWCARPLRKGCGRAVICAILRQTSEAFRAVVPCQTV